jgi:hypothetical protein
MTPSFGQISQVYPTLASSLLNLDANERTDVDMMSCLGRHVVELFEAARADPARCWSRLVNPELRS